MAVPTYTTDLTAQVISTCESNSTPLVFTNIGTGADATETDYFIQGSACVSKPFNITAGGIYCTTSVAITTSGYCYWAWYYFGCPNALLGETAGGMQAMVGQSGTAYDKWDVFGNDTYTYGGWRCVPVDILNIGYDDRVGAGKGSSPYLIFGVYTNTSASISKGNPLGIDVMRYGRGQMRITGGSSGSGYATFAGFATQNDNTTNRWGLFQVIDGAYLWQGLMLLGLSTLTTTYRARNTSVATLTTSAAHGLVIGDTVVITGVGGSNYNTTTTVATVPTTTTFTYANAYADEGSTADTGGSINGVTEFTDSNKNILIANTKKVQSTFNAIEIRNASSIINWTGIQISALGTNSKGMLTVVDNADVNFQSNTFNDMGTFTFMSNSTLIDCIFRRCDQVTGGGAAFNSCTFTNSTASVSLVLTNLNQVTDCNFISDGSNHAINLGTISSSVSMNWNNYLTNYATSDGSSGNEAILVSVSSGQTLTINVGTGYSTPSIYNTGSGTVSVVSGQVTTSVTVKDLTTGNNIDGARVLIWATDASNKGWWNASVTITGSGTTATVTHAGHGLVTGDKVIISGVTNDDDYNGVFSITYISSGSYSYTADDTLTSPATGTPVAKWAIISGLTNASGYIEDVRSFGSAQLITGWVRQTSGSPYYYQEGAISGTISTANGFNSTIQLVRDE